MVALLQALLGQLQQAVLAGLGGQYAVVDQLLLVLQQLTEEVEVRRDGRSFAFQVSGDGGKRKIRFSMFRNVLSRNSW